MCLGKKTVITMAKDEAKSSDFSKGLLKSEELYKVSPYSFISLSTFSHISSFEFPFSDNFP